jgi:hypothetical protein
VRSLGPSRTGVVSPARRFGRRRKAKNLAEIIADFLDLRRARTREDERTFLAAPLRRKNDEIFGKKLRLARDGHTIEFDRLCDRLGSFPPDESQLARFFVGRDEGAEKIGRDAAATTADARNSPGDSFAEQVLLTENRRQICRQVQR